mgnify:FL=1
MESSDYLEGIRRGRVAELSFNVDDMTGEELGFAMEGFLEEGAHEVYSVPVMMKKSRPGNLIKVLCDEKDKEKMVGLIFRNTTTNGVREQEYSTYVVSKKMEEVGTSYGIVRRKTSSGAGMSRSKYEYDDVSKIARDLGISIREVRKRIMVEDFGKNG